MEGRRLNRLIMTVVAALAAVAALATSSASSQTIAVNLELDDAAAVDVTVSDLSVSIQDGNAIISGTVSGTVSVAGVSGKIPSQSIQLTVGATCKSGRGTLTLKTTPISATLSNGTTATVGGATVPVSATCGKTPTLTVTAAPATVSVTDGTTVSTSQCTVKISAPASTTLGATICEFQNLICELATDIASGDTTNIVALLNKILSKTQTIA
jgi:hypothetical protein